MCYNYVYSKCTLQVNFINNGGRYDSSAIIGSFVGPPVNYVIFYIPYLVNYMTNKSYVES